MIDTLHYISQPAADGSHLTAIRQALEAGCRWIQLRIKDEPARQIEIVASAAVALCHAQGARLIVNDHPDIALRTGADGVHLGLEDLPVSEARKLVGNQFLIGGTANTFDQVAQRAAEGVDYIGLGPFRFTTTKKQLSPVLGIAGYEQIIRQARRAGIELPIIAIGGLRIADLPMLVQAGVHGAAISGTITHAADRKAVVQQAYAQLQKNASQPIVNA